MNSLQGTAQGGWLWRVERRDDGGATERARVNLPEGGDTSVAEALRLTAAALGGGGGGASPQEEKQTLRVLRGFPPRACLTGEGTVAEDGMQNMESLVVVLSGGETTTRGAGKETKASGKKKSTSAAKKGSSVNRVTGLASPSTKTKKRRKAPLFPGKGVKLGRGEEGPQGLAVDAAGKEKDDGFASMLTEGTGAMLGDVNHIGLDMVRAAHGGGGGGGRDATVQSLHEAMKNAVLERKRENDGIARLAAAETGQTSFEALGDGRLVVRWKGGTLGATARGGGGGEEIVQDLPKIFCPLILGALASDPDKNVQRYLKRPAEMAIASPRVFWGLVRHWNVGRGRTMAEAIAACLPGFIDAEEVNVRDRKKPERYANYVSH